VSLEVTENKSASKFIYTRQLRQGGGLFDSKLTLSKGLTSYNIYKGEMYIQQHFKDRLV
jgi:hypothetical protein